MLVTTKCTKDNVGWRTNDRKHSFDLNRTSSYPPTNISLQICNFHFALLSEKKRLNIHRCEKIHLK